MRQRWRCVAVLTCVILGLSGGRAGAEGPPPRALTIAADEWCPINCRPGQERQGIGVDLAKAIFEPLGYRVEYVIMPWARALEEARQGRVDAVVGANTADDPSLIFPDSFVLEITDDFYALQGRSIAFSGVESLKGLRVGYIKDYGYGKEINAFLERQRGTPGSVQEVSGEDALEQNIRKLMAGRIDVVLESSAVMDYTLKEKNLADKVKRIGGLPQGHVFVAFSPRVAASKERSRQFDAGMRRLEASGELRALYGLYGLQP